MIIVSEASRKPCTCAHDVCVWPEAIGDGSLGSLPPRGCARSLPDVIVGLAVESSWSPFGVWGDAFACALWLERPVSVPRVNHWVMPLQFGYYLFFFDFFFLIFVWGRGE